MKIPVRIIQVQKFKQEYLGWKSPEYKEDEKKGRKLLLEVLDKIEEQNDTTNGLKPTR